MAESQGFEPWVRDYRTHDFQSCAFDHSANSPYDIDFYRAAQSISLSDDIYYSASLLLRQDFFQLFLQKISQGL